MDHGGTDRRFCVYLHIDNYGSVKYIGSGTRKRCFNKNRNDSEHLEAWDSLKKVILLDELTKSESLDLEQRLLDAFDCTKLFNKSKVSNKTKDVIYEDVSKVVYYDETSPTLLRRLVKSNKQKVNDPAGFNNGSGMKVSIDNVTYYLHRIVYCLNTKKDLPTNLVIDHIDRDRYNNKFSNLRAVTQKENCYNRGVRSDNETGYVGISWDVRNLGYHVYWYENFRLRSKLFLPRTLFPDLDEESGKQAVLDVCIKFREEKLNLISQTEGVNMDFHLRSNKEDYWLDSCYKDVFLFNDIAGNTNRLSEQDLLNQFALIREETNELEQALAENNLVEILDAVVDIYVVLNGFTSKLEALGYNVSSALQKTCENNLSKFPLYSDEVITGTKDKYNKKGVELDIAVLEDKRTVFRNKETGKIVKPSNYISNDLSSFVPVQQVGFNVVDTFEESQRGECGFGSTGSNTSVLHEGGKNDERT